MIIQKYIFRNLVWNIPFWHFFYQYQSYDLVFTAGADAIIEKFLKLDAGVLFAAEDAIWPDRSLEVIGS